MSGTIEHTKFILVGGIPLFTVTSMSQDEEFRLPELGASKSQWLGKTTFTVTIQGALIGPERFFYKAGLEAMAEFLNALTSLPSIPLLSGTFIVSGLTTMTDMHITKLTFNQTSDNQGVVGVTIAMKHCPPGLVAELIGKGLNLAGGLAGSIANVASGMRSVPGPWG